METATKKTASMLTAATVLIAVAAMLLTAGTATAAQFGGWVDIGQTTNSDDDVTFTEDGTTTGPWGAVDYQYQIARQEVTVEDWDEFYDSEESSGLGLSGPSGTKPYTHWRDVNSGEAGYPVVHLSMYQASAYANYLTSGSVANGVYDIDGNGWATAPVERGSAEMDALVAEHGTVYAVPTQDEWYKAAYYSLANQQYNTYADGTDTAPSRSGEDGTVYGETGWNYDKVSLDDEANWGHDIDGTLGGMWKVSDGSEEENLTLNMMGNVRDWLEDLSVRYTDHDGLARGGTYRDDDLDLAAGQVRDAYAIADQTNSGVNGFRLVAIPEPSSLLLLGIAGLLLMKRRRV